MNLEMEKKTSTSFNLFLEKSLGLDCKNGLSSTLFR
jgi:hypothetical protein